MMNIKKMMILFCVFILLNSCISISALNNIDHLKNSATTKSLVPGVKICQVDFTFPEATEINSDWGRIEIDIKDITTFFDLEAGFVNIFTDTGWVVQNLFINKIEGIKSLTTYFNLGKEFEGIDVENLSLHFAFNELPVVDFIDGKRETYAVGNFPFNAEGYGEGHTSQTSDPMPNIDFYPYQDTFNFTKPVREGENVQCANNQCFPMSVANSLQYLENEHLRVNIPHDHLLGQDGDDTLVGQLDAFSGRNVTNRTSGGGIRNVGMLEGKFEYLNSIGLTDVLTHRHQGTGRKGDDPPPGDFTYAGITSIDESVNNNVTFEWIYEQVEKCADVEIGYFREPENGHAVRVIGAGKTLGNPWIRYIHDGSQAELDSHGNIIYDDVGLETVQVYINDLDGDGYPNFGANHKEIGFALSEYTPSIMIIDIIGGFGINVVIENYGPDIEPDVNYQILIEPLIIFFGGVKEGDVDIPPGEILTIKSGLFFGLGPAKITVNLWVKEDKISKTLNGFVFGPIIILND